MTFSVESFFDLQTCTVTHVVADLATGSCAVIDPVLDYDSAAVRLSTGNADAVVDHIRKKQLTVQWVLETHAHADHLTAAQYLKDQCGGQVGIGAKIDAVQDTFGRVYNLGGDFVTNGGQFDVLFQDGDDFLIGDTPVRVLHTPGHTPACVTYIIGEKAAFVGDTLFMPDFGTARCDFPGGDAGVLFDSIQKILSLPDETALYMCHDYAPGGRDYAWQTTVAAARENIHLKACPDRADFMAMRTARDKTLKLPLLLLPAVQVNIRAGHLPDSEENGVKYLKLPVDQF